MPISENIHRLREEIGPETTLLAVTKGATREQIDKAIADGVTDIGENRLQEAQTKLVGIPTHVQKHFIGPLQTNKARGVVELFDVIQSVDRLKLAKKINEAASELGKQMPILIQVNTSNESQKGGVTPEEAEELVREVSRLKHLQIEGLMTIAIHSDDNKEVRACFRKLRELFEHFKTQKIPNVEMRTLSMGMSFDYLLALEEGSTMIRIGSKLFD